MIEVFIIGADLDATTSAVVQQVTERSRPGTVFVVEPATTASGVDDRIRFRETPFLVLRALPPMPVVAAWRQPSLPRPLPAPRQPSLAWRALAVVRPLRCPSSFRRPRRWRSRVIGRRRAARSR